eukprot:CAMPEP_0177625592 /NCGR_PEP_ID=MMETSP0419_2-20121207/30187_1 /TAXON_ID=582737 /ORGANISM="Tetraselmis sp., Strain GSL018" /LENGTH=113 /DNA_ID=CAMNT_0019126559 /DNA_START=699 /DNA_END=1037 /DNA_ORIENTATION=+
MMSCTLLIHAGKNVRGKTTAGAQETLPEPSPGHSDGQARLPTLQVHEEAPTIAAEEKENKDGKNVRGKTTAGAQETLPEPSPGHSDGQARLPTLQVHEEAPTIAAEEKENKDG